MIKEVSIDHDLLSFKVFYGTHPGMVWKGHWRDDDHFVMTLSSNKVSPSGRGSSVGFSASELEQARVRAPKHFITHKLPLPELRDLLSNGLGIALGRQWFSSAEVQQTSKFGKLRWPTDQRSWQFSSRQRGSQGFDPMVAARVCRLALTTGALDTLAVG